MPHQSLKGAVEHLFAVSSPSTPSDARTSDACPTSRLRGDIPDRYKWNLTTIFPNWETWEAALARLEEEIATYRQLKGTLASGPAALLNALQAGDSIGEQAYRIYYYPSLRHDEDQRDNTVGARKQRAEILLAKATEAGAWFNPEVLKLSLSTVRKWLAENHENECGALSTYRFALEELFRQQEHVLDHDGEHLMALGSRLRSAPAEAYAALTTADMKFPTITLTDGQSVTVSYGRYRALLSKCREQEDRKNAFEALYGCYSANLNTYAALYASIAERDWFVARARNYPSTLAAALHRENIPVSVVENLISVTRQGVAPLQRYHRLRKTHLKLSHYHFYDTSLPLVQIDRKYYYDRVRDAVIGSTARLGQAYQHEMRRAFEERWVDVYENEGKRSGAYSASVYGIHPFMLLNYNDTLNDAFTLAHEMGHSMHTILAQRAQPFTYANYSIFVAEIASTLNEAFLLDYLLDDDNTSKSPLSHDTLGGKLDRASRIVLLQHAIDSICSTFYTQVLFADWELQAHRALEQGKAITAETLSELYMTLVDNYYGDAISPNPLYAATWARIPHFYGSPYYVYQYATCFAASVRIHRMLNEASTAGQEDEIVENYLAMLAAGGSDHPIEVIRKAGVDLCQPSPINAVVEHLDNLVSILERELAEWNGT